MAQRLFFAIPVSVPKQMALIKHQAHLGNLGHVVPATNFHLTLAFLGNVTQSQQQALIERWRDLTVPNLHLTLNRYLHFPKAGVVCLASDQVPIALMRLAQSLRRDAARHGLHSHKAAFRPHVTLYRGVDSVVELPQPEPVTLEINEVQLMASQREMGKLTYSPLVRWRSETTN
ncbi:RNA 2',3'-cyclic phosphodiesterase [Ferrimonas aestuarii]|uniref:RNA 2',3'-cyclic phosphodiesterase n=1 Tax=Ferrimonas aestuarii TaxID=2569539 RepID=A0A4U1BRC7_9GAMM|nr:RNA 2',3'-cyclic phosphodiesterase [Ferrimonas aestuarii]TKB56708.1 RNA 2',3'-cyclic phosphodiesterase [Ferrimonas aestuarii]